MKREYEITVLSKGAYARTVRIYSPKKADRALIMHDGQNVFYDGEAAYNMSWRMLDAVKELKIKNVAVIGIDNAPTREDDYMPFKTELDKYGFPSVGGNADAYCEYISETVLPYLTKRFGYKLYGMLGSSAGAIATLYYATKTDERIKAYGMFSTPLFVAPDAFGKMMNECDIAPDAMYRVYVGGNETENVGEYSEMVPDLYVDDAHTLVKFLRSKGVKDLKQTLENTNPHNEISWRAPAREFLADFSKL